MEVVFRIEILCGHERVPVKLEIQKMENDLHQVWYISTFIKNLCGVFFNPNEAYYFLKTIMKLAMKNSLLFHICPFCRSKYFLPENICPSCDYIFGMVDFVYQNEIVYNNLHFSSSHASYREKNVSYSLK